ncbi:transcriptional regulator, LuxR family [Verrucomicrobium sp. GAS474]|uniref:helix-turn-helix transcriptional regulator n=1 Tax=Verrucomicrobium sp. GAS474 TaxID=1882831 RepID=UPI00087CD95F|nr:LuxR C-terminal-related transcriptional regulator [Verrucomicrobium sp. GAS474]SDT87686.1 transcriptional regulator, LuxR family [Verrucomicrobium sp. GAS474]
MQGRVDRAAGREKVYQLWDALSSYPTARTDQALHHLLDTVSTWIGADNAQWIGAIRPAHLRISEDYLLGWRMAAQRLLHPPTPAQLALFAEIRRQSREGPVDAGMTTHATVARAGTFRVHRLHDGVRNGFVDFAAFRQTSHYRLFYEKLGVRDRLWIAFPLNEDAESYILFDRTQSPRFTQAEAALAASALRGLRWFHLRLFLDRGLLVGDKALTPMQRRVVHGLLTGKEEKAVAAELGQSPATTHKHVEAVYRALGVNSRAALMALWLAGR